MTGPVLTDHEVDIEDIEYLRHGDKPLLARLFKPRGPGPFPLVVEVQPRGGGSAVVRTGARPSATARTGRATRRMGEGPEVRELRDHQPGDPFRRIAWKASAHRGRHGKSRQSEKPSAGFRAVDDRIVFETSRPRKHADGRLRCLRTVRIANVCLFTLVALNGRSVVLIE